MTMYGRESEHNQMTSGPPVNVLREPTTTMPPVQRKHTGTGDDPRIIHLYLPAIIVLRNNQTTYAH